MKHSIRAFSAAVILCLLFSMVVWGQTNPAAQSIPYSQDFSLLAHSSTTYPTGWQGWQLSTQPGLFFSTAAPTGDKVLTASSTAATISGNVHNYNGKIGFLNSSSLDLGIVLAINTTSNYNIQVGYDIMTIRNPYDGTTNTRINEITLQYRVGTSGAFTSLTGIEYQNNQITQTGSVTTPQNSQTKTITLPSACNNQSVVQLRWASRQISGAGSRPSFAVDNISITSEPTAQPTSLLFSSVTINSFTVSFTAASPSADGYIAIRKAGSAPSGTPVDGTTYTVGNTINDGTVAYVGSGVTFDESSLTPNTNYYYAIYSYNGSGAGTNYLLTSPLTGNQQTNAPSNSQNSDIIAAGNEVMNIAYASYQSSSITTTSEGLRVFSFTIRDGGGSADSDSDPTMLTSITITKGGSNSVSNWANTIRRAALFDGSSNIAEISVGGETISFSGLNVSAPDDGSKTLDLYLTFETTITDNQQFQLEITNSNVTNPSSGSSLFTSFVAVNSSTTSDANRMEVTATKLVFTAQPSFFVRKNVNFSATLEAQDANSNIDSDATTNVTIARGTGNGTLSSATGTTQNLSSGSYSWSDLQLDTKSTSTTLTTTNTGGLSNATSNSFEVYEGLFLENFDYTSGQALTANGWSAHSGGGSNAILVYESGLTYANYEGSNIGKAARLTASGEDVNRTFTSVTSGTIYLSFLVNVTSATATGDYFIHFADNAASNFRARIFAKDVSGSLEFGLLKETGTTVYTSNAYSYATTYLLVAKYEFLGGSGDDVVSLFVNPAIPAAEPGVPTLTFTTGVDASIIGSICIRQGSNTPVLTVDGIRIAASWAEIPLPVEVTSFTYDQKFNEVKLRWTTATETNNFGFEIERRNINLKSEVSNLRWTKVGFVQGAGTTTSPKEYTFTDNPQSAGRFVYRLKQIDRDGAFKYYGSLEIEIVAAPMKLALSENYPNPFNPSTVIWFTVPDDGRAIVKLFNVVGEEVGTLFDDIATAGRYYEVIFNASRLSSGVYFYAIQYGNQRIIKKMMLVR